MRGGRCAKMCQPQPRGGREERQSKKKNSARRIVKKVNKSENTENSTGLWKGEGKRRTWNSTKRNQEGPHTGGKSHMTAVGGEGWEGKGKGGNASLTSHEPLTCQLVQKPPAPMKVAWGGETEKKKNGGGKWSTTPSRSKKR